MTANATLVRKHENCCWELVICIIRKQGGIILKKVFVPLMVTLLIAVMGVGSMCFAEGVAIPAGGGYSEQAA